MIGRAESIVRGSALLLTAIPAVLIVFMPVRSWIDHFLIGDAAAYSIVACHVANGDGLTYDGITATNGFHPLWMLLHVPLMAAATSPLARLFLVKILVTLSVLACVAAWMRVARIYLRNDLAAWTLTAWMGASGWTLYVLYAGMETALVVFFVAMSLIAVRPFVPPAGSTAARPGLRQVLLLGAACALCFLSRLDSVFFLFPLFVFALIVTRKSWRLQLTAASVFAGAVAGPFLIFNRARFGAFTPVSGIVKIQDNLDPAASVSVLTGSVERIGTLLPSSIEPFFPFAMAGGGLAALAATVVVLVRPKLGGRRNPLIVLPIAAVLHFTYYLLFVRELLVPWHMYLQVITVYVAMAAAVAVTAVRWRGAVSLTLLVILVTSTAGYPVMKQTRRSDRRGSYLATEWVRALPEGTRLAMHDGWYVQLLAGPKYHVLDLSGLVSDRPTAVLAREKQYDRILEMHRIEYVIGIESFVTALDSVLVVRSGDITRAGKPRRLALATRSY